MIESVLRPHASTAAYWRHIREQVVAGDCAVVDESAPSLTLARLLHRSGVTVLTTAVDVAGLRGCVSGAAQIVILPGVLDRPSRSVLVNEDALDYVRDRAPRWGFFGGAGYTAAAGLLERSPGLAVIKHRLSQLCTRPVAHIGAEQVGAFAPYPSLGPAAVYETHIIGTRLKRRAFPGPAENAPVHIAAGNRIC